MNWHYGNPIVNKQYLCCVHGYASPIPLYFHDGDWIPFITERSLKDDYCSVECWIGFDEIPMPENW